MRSGGECGLVYYNRFQMPKPPGPQSVAGGYIKRNNAPGSFVGPNILPEWCASPFNVNYDAAATCVHSALPVCSYVVSLNRTMQVLV